MKPLLASPLAFLLAVIAVVATGLVLPIYWGYQAELVGARDMRDDPLTTVMMCLLVLAPGIALVVLTARDLKSATSSPRGSTGPNDDLFALAWEMSFQYQATRVLFIAAPMLLVWSVGLANLARAALPLTEWTGWYATDTEAVRSVAIHLGLWVGYPVLLRAGTLLAMGRLLSLRGSLGDSLFDSGKQTLLYSLGVALYLAGLGAAMRLLPVRFDYKGIAGYFYVILALYTLLFAGLVVVTLSLWSRRDR